MVKYKGGPEPAVERTGWNVINDDLREVLENYREELVETLQQLIRIPSVAGAPEEGKPNGPECDRALNFLLQKAAEKGFTVKNVDGYAGHVEYGEGEEYVCVMNHLDVVAAGEGWTRPPFGGVLEGNLLYGRGATDNKGPAVAALYCLCALRDLGLSGTKRLRLIWGTQEETGMDDLRYYFGKEGEASMGFSPDGGYALFNKERGMLRYTLTAPAGECAVLSLRGGDSFNVIPDCCEAVLKEGTAREEALLKLAEQYRTERSSIEVNRTEEGLLKVTARGVRGYTSRAHISYNANALLLEFLNAALGAKAGILQTAASNLEPEGDGAKLHLAFQGEEAVCALAMNAAVLELDGGRLKLQLDIRFPIYVRMEDIQKRLEERFAGFEMKLEKEMPAHYAPEDGEICTCCRTAYESVTGKKIAVGSVGGGTYAKLLPGRAIAFGDHFNGEAPPCNVHGPDENVDLNFLMKHCVICARAMYEMMR